MKKSLTLILAVMLCLVCAMAQAAPFTDSTGRTIDLPDEITRVAVTGSAAQIVTFAVAPDMLVGIASDWDDGSEPYVGQYADLPVLGQLYGGKGDMNLEELMTAAPQVVIDAGETKDGVGEDLTALSEQSGIPFVHIGITLDTAPQAFRMLGGLLGREERAEEIAVYCEDVLARVDAIMEQVGENRARLIYCLGEEGLSVLAKGSYHAEIIDRVSDNVAVVDSPSSRGTGNQIDMEQMLIWNPDYIVFSPDSADVSADPVWQGVNAAASGRYVKTPSLPYNWMGYPPSVQRYLGMLWLCDFLYPEQAQLDMYAETARYYDLFYHCDLTREQYDILTAEAFVQ
ncbi:MAG: ABC transporter substrate-binding protein [Clostridia bacterium]|nr:ABC transporter substrate-binding protein [Clostridia bacterium]